MVSEMCQELAPKTSTIKFKNGIHSNSRMAFTLFWGKTPALLNRTAGAGGSRGSEKVPDTHLGVNAVVGGVPRPVDQIDCSHRIREMDEREEAVDATDDEGEEGHDALQSGRKG